MGTENQNNNQNRGKKKLVSIVIPCYNEEGNMIPNVESLIEVMAKSNYRYEIICVDDGSKDNTWEKIKELSKKFSEVKGIKLMRNHGMTQAYMAGFDASKGDYVLTLSADMEISPENVIKVVEYLEEGYDFVNTSRKDRWGKAGRALPSKIANSFISKISGVSMQDTGSGLKGFDRVMIDNFKMYGEMHRFIPSYLADYGAKMIEFDVDYKERKFGKSSYGSITRTLKVLLDMITLAFMLNLNRKPFRALPGRLFGFTGALVSGLGGLGTLYLLILKLMGESIGSRPLFIVSVLMLVVGVQMVMVGMIGELLMRVYFEAGGRKTYTVRETV